MGMAVAAISEILTDFEAGMWNHRLRSPRPRKRLTATQGRPRRQSFSHDRGRFTLPDSPNGKAVKHFIVAEDRDFFDLSLSDQQAVERVFVW